MIIDKLKAVLELNDKDKSLFSVARSQLLAERELHRSVIEKLLTQRNMCAAMYRLPHEHELKNMDDLIIDMLDKEKS